MEEFKECYSQLSDDEKRDLLRAMRMIRDCIRMAESMDDNSLEAPSFILAGVSDHRDHCPD